MCCEFCRYFTWEEGKDKYFCSLDSQETQPEWRCNDYENLDEEEVDSW